jgi:FKBP12-rapamycin complex-associated protein
LVTDEVQNAADLKAPDASEYEYEAMANAVGVNGVNGGGGGKSVSGKANNNASHANGNGANQTNATTIAAVAAVGDVRNKRALEVVRRIQNKLNGRDFNPNVSLTVPEQIQKLVQEATSLENLCVAFIGWCSL